MSTGNRPRRRLEVELINGKAVVNFVDKKILDDQIIQAIGEECAPSEPPDDPAQADPDGRNPPPEGDPPAAEGSPPPEPGGPSPGSTTV